MKKITFALIITFAFYLVHPSACPAGMNDGYKEERESLRGLEGVRVIIESDNILVNHQGFTVQQIQADIELRLQVSGIKILTNQEYIKVPGSPYLNIDINIFFSNALQVYVYSLNIDLRQDVVLNRDKSLSFIGVPTWTSPGRVGIIESSDLKNLPQKINAMVEEFIYDYLRMNQRVKANNTNSPK